MYLTDDAVKATLAALGKFARGSELVMDFVPEESAELEGAVEDSVTQLRKVVETMGEPMKSRYSPDKLETRLHDAEFTNVDFYSAKRIVNEMLGGARDAFAMPDDAVHTLVAHI
jgi:O-methyltransferase involved in polyketide biosynthesis